MLPKSASRRKPGSLSACCVDSGPSFRWDDGFRGISTLPRAWIRGRMSPIRNIVVLTGAGVSAESGIDTFRDAGGLWEQHRVEDVATPEAFADRKSTRLNSRH